MKILVATNGAYDPERDSAHRAFSFPWPEGSEIHVLTVAEVTYPVMVAMGPDPIDVTDIEMPTREEVRSIANGAALRFRELGLLAEGFTATGDPETEILEHAREWGADLIAVGWHDRSRLERLLVGSVSEHVVKNAPCSVLVLKDTRED
jgi:nucleotide-binding universal stress UspA family protein